MPLAKKASFALCTILYCGSISVARADYVTTSHPCPVVYDDIDRAHELNDATGSLLFAIAQAECAYASSDYESAKRILERVNDTSGGTEDDQARFYWLLSDTEEKLGNLHAASDDIRKAKSIEDTNPLALLDKLGEPFRTDYARISAPALRYEHQQQVRQDTANSQLFWSTLSESQRHVVRREGGTASANTHSRPCHVERYDSAAYHKITWWYCDSDGHYEHAYIFLNGRLDSEYSP